MRKILFSFLFIIISVFAFSQITLAQGVRQAECDLCGYCKNYNPAPPQTNPPANWPECRKCLYEAASEDPLSGDTLKIDVSTNMPPTPYPGHMFTMIGCISSNLSDFTQEGAAANIVNLLLNNLIFPLSGGIALMFLIYGSFLILTSQAEPEKLNQGKRVVMGSIIGIIFVIFSVFIVNIIANGVLKIPGFSSP